MPLQINKFKELIQNLEIEGKFFLHTIDSLFQLANFSWKFAHAAINKVF